MNNSSSKSPAAHRFAALLLAVLFALALPLTVFAEGETVTLGSDENTLTIETVEDLLAFAENCRLDSYSQGLTVTLACDLDVGGSKFAGIPTFGGTFDGGAHTITGLNLAGEGSVVGFFRYLQKGALVQGLHLSGNVAPAGTKCTVGGLAGRNAGTIQNCTFAGIVTGTDTIGGLVGLNETTGVVNGCSNRGVCYGNHSVGGIVGDNRGVVSACTNRCGVNTTAVQNQNASSLDNITLDSLLNTTNVAELTDIGGVAGTSSGVIRASTNRGVVGYRHVGYNVGGIAGSQSGYLEGCVNYGTIYARKEAGGIVGQMEPSSDLQYMPDTLQVVSGQLYTLQGLTNQAASDAQASNSAMTGQINALQSQVSNAYSAVTNLVDSTVDNFTPSTTDLSGLLGGDYNLDDLNLNTDDLNLNLDDLSGRLDELRGRPVHHVDEDWPDVDLDLDLDESDSMVAARNDFNGSMTGIFNSVGNLNASASDGTSALVNDIRAISNQINKIGQTLSGAGQHDGDIVEDVSDNDTAQDTAGKVLNCVNYGDVQADINAGGITGAMAPENDLDPEDDIQINGDSSLNFTYKTRAVLRDCENRATVSAQKRGAGGILGEMQMGTVQNSLNLGTLDAADAEKVGGIAGSSSSSIRGCYAKCDVSGATQVGGIAGSGFTLTDCRAQVRIIDATEQYGAIAGLCSDYNAAASLTEENSNTDLDDDKETSTVAGNYFLYDDKRPLGGLDGVSYQGVAEGLSQGDFAALENLPDVFDGITLRFLGEDETVVSTFTCPYGSAFAMADLPDVPAKAGNLGEWDGLADADLSDLRYNETFTALYTPLYSALASTEMRDENRPIALLEGAFEASSTELLTAWRNGELPDLPEAASGADDPALLDAWVLNLPGRAATADTIENEGLLHYLPPAEQNGKALNPADVLLYLRGADGSWRLAATELDGSYLVAQTNEGDNALCAIYAPAPPYKLFAALGGGALAVVLILMLLARKRRKKRKAKKDAKRAAEAEETEDNEEPEAAAAAEDEGNLP